MENVGIDPWDALAAQFQGITLELLFSIGQPERLNALAERARALDPASRPAHLNVYFAVSPPPGVNAEAVAKILSQWESVATAYVEPPPVEPPFVNASDDPRSVNQGYLDPTPDGIDADTPGTFLAAMARGTEWLDRDFVRRCQGLQDLCGGYGRRSPEAVF